MVGQERWSSCYNEGVLHDQQEYSHGGLYLDKEVPVKKQDDDNNRSEELAEEAGV